MPGTRLRVQRLFEYDLVPHRSGSLSIPALKIPYYDPVDAAYATADAASIRVEVSDRRDVDPALPPAQSVTMRGTEVADGAWIGAVLLAGAAGTAVIATIVRRRRQTPAPAAVAADQIGRARAARAAGDRDAEAAALARALWAALQPHLVPGAAGNSEPAARPGHEARVAAALEALTVVERARFDPGASLPRHADVERAIDSL